MRATKHGRCGSCHTPYARYASAHYDYMWCPTCQALIQRGKHPPPSPSDFWGPPGYYTDFLWGAFDRVKESWREIGRLAAAIDFECEEIQRRTNRREVLD